MENNINAPIKPALICLGIAWVFAILPIPFISFFGMVVMNIVAFILAIVCITRNAVGKGIAIIFGCLFGTVIAYSIGISLMAGGIASAFSESTKKAQPQLSQMENSASKFSASDLEGSWKGVFIYENGTSADFEMKIENPSEELISGTLLDMHPITKEKFNSVISGDVHKNKLKFIQKYPNQSEEIECEGEIHSERLKGKCVLSNMTVTFTAEKDNAFF